MSVLSIAQAIVDRVGTKSITSLFTNPDKNERQIRSVIQGGGRALCQKTNSQGDGWSVLTRIYEFTTTSEAEYALPSDLKKFVVRSAWQKDKYWLMRGSLSGRQWERVRNRQTSQGYNVFRIFRTQKTTTFGAVGQNEAPNIIRKFHIEPAPGPGIDIVFEYVSNAFWVSADGSTIKETPTQDDDESMFGDEIHILDGVWRFKQANSRNYAADLAVFEDFRDTMMVQDMSADDPIPVGNRGLWGYANVDESDVTWCP